nr:MAG TPA: D-MONELLIN CHAIN A, D-MONELLIN CHAIN/BETA, ALL-D PROTEIN, DE NOVO.8A [Caudoviricetes sp.]
MRLGAFFDFVDVNKIGSHARLWYNKHIRQ